MRIICAVMKTVTKKDLFFIETVMIYAAMSISIMIMIYSTNAYDDRSYVNRLL